MKLFWQTCFVLSTRNDTVPPPPKGIPIIEPTNAKSASVGTLGGRVTTSASNGMTYTLIVPPNALNETVNIRLTPISSLGNSSPADGLAGAVQMEPSGLQFKRAAILRIGIAPAVASGKKLFGFETANDGTQFALNLPNIKNGNTELSIYQFGNSGLGTATLPQIAALPDLALLART
jgi:hypothetical protein